MNTLYAAVASKTATGVIKKLEERSLSLSKVGSGFKFVCFAPFGEAFESSHLDVIELPKFKPRTANILLPRILANHFKNSGCDVVVLRYIHQTPFFWFAFRKRTYKLVLEYHSLMFRELLCKGNKRLAYLYQWSRPLCDRVIDGKVCVTREIAAVESNSVSSTRVISNGSDIGSFPVSSSPPINHGPLVILFVGSTNQPWHGLDRLLISLRCWEQVSDRPFELHLVGDLNVPKRLVKELKSKIFLHGYLKGEALSELFNRAHIGVSSLALYKKQMEDACSLKSREYMARGLPFIYAYTDPDIDVDARFALRVSNDSTVIPFEKLETFVIGLSEQQQRGDHIAEEIRKYASNSIDLHVKSKELVEFLGCL